MKSRVLSHGGCRYQFFLRSRISIELAYDESEYGGKKRECKIDGWMVGYACRVQPCNGQTSGEAKLEIEHCVPTLQPMYINHLKIRGLEPQYTHKCIKFDIWFANTVAPVPTIRAQNILSIKERFDVHTYNVRKLIVGTRHRYLSYKKELLRLARDVHPVHKDKTTKVFFPLWHFPIYSKHTR